MSTSRRGATATLAFSLSLASCASAPTDQNAGEPPPSPAATFARAVAAQRDAAPESDSAPPEPFCAGRNHRVLERLPYRWCVGPGGEPDGGFEVDDGAGRLELQGRFASGVPVGTWEATYPNNTPRWRHTVARPGAESYTTAWHQDGSKHYEIVRRDGRRVRAAFYAPGGSKRAELTYEAGRPSGTWRYYRDDGQLAHRYHPGDAERTIHEHWSEAGDPINAPKGMLPRAAMRRAEAPLEAGVVRCYEHAVALFPELAGRLVAQFRVGYGGEVAEASLIDEGLGHPMMTLCARRELESVTFPENPYGPRLIVRSWDLRTE